MANEIAVRDAQVPALPGEMSVQGVLEQVSKIQDLMKAAMKDGEHYGTIPGTSQNKKTLLKPGAEKLCLMFRFAPEYSHEILRDGEHMTVVTKCTLIHSPSETKVATGSGMCSTRESKYAWRKVGRKCPACGREGTIIKGKAEYGGGWLCWSKAKPIAGCGAKFADGVKEIESQEEGRKANEDIADQYNTILKMADKRALVAAVLNGTAASDIFTQDLEDIQENLRARGVEPEGERVDTSTSQETPREGTETAPRGRGRPRKDQPVETTASAAPSQPTGLFEKAAETVAPTSKAGNTEGVITAQEATWVLEIAEKTGANLGMMLGQFAPALLKASPDTKLGELIPRLSYEQFNPIKKVLERRIQMKGAE